MSHAQCYCSRHFSVKNFIILAFLVIFCPNLYMYLEITRPRDLTQIQSSELYLWLVGQPKFSLQFTFCLQSTFIHNSLVHDPASLIYRCQYILMHLTCQPKQGKQTQKRLNNLHVIKKLFSLLKTKSKL